MRNLIGREKNFQFKIPNYEILNFREIILKRITLKILLKGGNQKMELNKDDIQRYRRSGMNFIGKYGNREPYDSYFVTHIKSFITFEFRNQHLASCCQTPMARSVSS